MSEVPTPPAVSEAMREAVAQWLRDRFPLNGWQSTAQAIALLKSGPIASEIARLTGERERWEACALACELRLAAAEAETARLQAALKLAENPLSYRHATDPNGPGSFAVARALEAVRAALTSQEKTDV